MRAIKTPEVLPFTLPIELLEYLLHHDGPHTLIVCDTRESFLEDLLANILQTRRPQPALSDPTNDVTDGQDQLHSLLVPSINILSVSKNINIIFCPTVQHARAFLSVFSPPASQQKDKLDSNGLSTSYLAILNLVTAHVGTSELSAQGLSRTLALAVDVATRARMNLVICECGSSMGQDEMLTGPDLWDTRIGLLNSTVRLGVDDQSQADVQIKVKRVAQRWFLFPTMENRGSILDPLES